MVTNFTAQAGEPFPPQAIRVRFPEGRDYWLTDDAFEARSEIRAALSESSELRGDLSEFLTATIDQESEDSDIVITLAMTGEQTRTLRSGVYDMVLSDVGAVDARAVVILSGRFTVSPVATSAGVR